VNFAGPHQPWDVTGEMHDRFSLVSGFDFGDDLAGDPDDPVLFDRGADPGETRSVAEEHPGVVDDLASALPE